MKLATSLLVPSICALVALGCEKQDSKKSESKSEPAASVVKAETPTPTPTPTAKKEVATAEADEKTSCDSPEGEAYDCSKAKLGCNQWDEAAAAVLEKKTPDSAVWEAYEVTGMKCGGCERKVIAKLGEIDGVVGVEADAELGQVRIATKGDADATKAARDALGKLYKITKKL